MGATTFDLSQIRTDATDYAATFRTLVGVYSVSQVDSLLSGLGALTAEDIDTLAEINAILTDADVASVTYVDGLAANYATAAQGTKADTALQPEDIASGTITPRDDDIDLSGGSIGDVITVQADGSLALSTPAGGAESPLTLTAGNATETPLTIQGAASQTEHMFGLKSSAAAVLTAFDANGRLVIGGSSLNNGGSTAYLHVKADAGDFSRMQISNASTSTGAGAMVAAHNDDGTNNGSSIRMMALGSAYSTVGGYIQDSGVLAAESGLSGGLNLIARAGGSAIRLYAGGHTNNVATFDTSTTAGNTRMLLWDVDSGALVRVSVGAADSGGSGFKVLRIPN